MNGSNITLSVSAGTYAYLYEDLCRYFLTWYLPSTIVIGSLGTLFSLFFLFCSKLFQSGVLVWLSSICIGDFLILMLEGVWILLKVWFKFDIRDQNDVICVIHKASSNYALYWSAYMQCALSVQRAYLVFKPLLARAHGSVSKRHIAAWITISLVLVIPMTPYAVYWRVIDGDCDPTDRGAFYLTTLCDLIIWGIIPLLGMTVATIVICLNMARVGKHFRKRHAPTPKIARKLAVVIQPAGALYNSRGQCAASQSMPSLAIGRSKSTTAVETLSTRIIVQMAPNAFGENGENLLRYTPCQLQRQPTERHVSRHNAPDNFGHVTRLLVCMNVAYMTSTFPLLIFLMFRNFSGVNVDPDVHRFFYYMCRSFCFLNSCTNWIFYCLVGKQFREEAKNILRMGCGLQRRRSTRIASTQSGKAAPVPVVPTPIVSRHASPERRDRAISVADVRRAVSRIPPR